MHAKSRLSGLCLALVPLGNHYDATVSAFRNQFENLRDGKTYFVWLVEMGV